MRRPVALIPAALAVAILVACPAALGQSAADQYIPQLEDTGSSKTGPGFAAPPPSAVIPGAEEAAPAAAELLPQPKEGTAGGGDAPGSDFPLTPFLILLLLVLLAALLARALRRFVAREA